jgi:hypothetical protein
MWHVLGGLGGSMGLGGVSFGRNHVFGGGGRRSRNWLGGACTRGFSFRKLGGSLRRHLHLAFAWCRGSRLGRTLNFGETPL